jgi:hypothetical protein
MEPRNLYICLVILARVGGGEPLKFIDAPIASDEEEAKEIAVAEARRQSPEYSSATLLEVTAYSFKRSKLEQAVIPS